MLEDGLLKFEQQTRTFAKIIVVGIGGGGGNAVNRMIESDIIGAEYVVINTDKQDLENSRADTRIQIGERVTSGLGAGGNPEKGQASAEENIQEIEAALSGADMVFITAGMGGGTGTGAAPIVAKIAQDLGILTVGIVTKPFSFEGRKRRDNAELGINYLRKYVDALVIVPNDKLLLVSDSKTSVGEALTKANEVLMQGVQGITDIITREGMINIDFADLKTILSKRGIAHIGIGKGSGENRVTEAVKGAIESPLLDTSINGSRAVLLNICGGYELGMLEVQSVADQIEQTVDKDAIVIIGIFVLEELGDNISVTVIATGFDEAEHISLEQPLKYGSKDNELPRVQPKPIIQTQYSQPEAQYQEPAPAPVAAPAPEPQRGGGMYDYQSNPEPQAPTNDNVGVSFSPEPMNHTDNFDFEPPANDYNKDSFVADEDTIGPNDFPIPDFFIKD